MLKQIILGEYIIPMSFIDSVSITESIYSPVISGIIIFNDSGFLEKTLKYSKNYNINFIVGDVTNDKDYLFSFVVHGFDDTTYDLKNNLINNKKVLKFSSFYSIDLLTGTNYLNFTNKTSVQMIKSICDKVDLKLNKITNSANTWDYVSPNCNLNDSINYISQRTLDNNSSGGYLFFPDLYLCKANFVNYFDITNGSVGVYNQPLVYDTMNDEFVGKIYDFKIVKEFNLLRELQKGAFNNKIISFDVLTGKIITDETSLLQNVSNNKNIFGYFPIDKDLMSDKVNSNVDVYCLNNEKMIKTIKNTKYYDMLMNQLQLELLTNGDYNKKLGNLVAVGINIFGENKKTNTLMLDRKISGTYIISDIEHFWKDTVYQQKTKTIKYGYSEVTDDKNLYKIH